MVKVLVENLLTKSKFLIHDKTNEITIVKNYQVKWVLFTQLKSTKTLHLYFHLEFIKALLTLYLNTMIGFTNMENLIIIILHECLGILSI